MATFYTAQAGLFRTSCRVEASPEQLAELDPRITTFETTGVFCLTEPDHGSDIAGGLATTAEREGDEWVINGTKMWITNGSVADVAVVWAQTDDKIRGFVVPTDTPGFTATEVTKKMTTRMIAMTEIGPDSG